MGSNCNLIFILSKYRKISRSFGPDLGSPKGSQKSRGKRGQWELGQGPAVSWTRSFRRRPVSRIAAKITGESWLILLHQVVQHSSTYSILLVQYFQYQYVNDCQCVSVVITDCLAEGLPSKRLIHYDAQTYVSSRLKHSASHAMIQQRYLRTLF